jgi:hypothetical protein
MPGKTNGSAIGQIDPETAVLGLFRTLTVQGAHTFTVYTSRKGRIWCTFKTWGDVPYASSCEVEDNATQQQLIRAIGIASTAHYHKVRGATARSDTWIGATDVESVWQEVARWLATEAFQEEKRELIDEVLESINTNGVTEQPSDKVV